MIDLRTHQNPLLRFLETALAEFREAHPTVSIGHMALYSCPWSGWVTLCVDSEPQEDQNCPDFEYVELAVYEAPDWASEYEGSAIPRVIDLEGNEVEIDVEAEGDEAFNRVFFGFLCDVLTTPTANRLLSTGEAPVRVGVQMLDSRLSRTWVPGTTDRHRERS